MNHPTPPTVQSAPPRGVVTQFAVFGVGFGVLMLSVAAVLYAVFGRGGGTSDVIAALLAAAGGVHLVCGTRLALRRTRGAVVATAVAATTTLAVAVVALLVSVLVNSPSRIGRAVSFSVFLGFGIAAVIRTARQACRALEDRA